jgi:hypothetical protein
MQGRSNCQNRYPSSFGNLLSADYESEIGDMCGDFRAFPTGKASLREGTAGSEATSDEAHNS